MKHTKNEHDLAEKIKVLQDYKSAFRDEMGGDISWFYSFVEWHAVVLFPNLKETIRAVHLVRQNLLAIELLPGKADEELAPLIRNAESVLKDLDKLHEKVDRESHLFEAVASLVHDLSDGIEVSNRELVEIGKRLDDLAKKQNATSSRREVQHDNK